jgi:pilus assembly protein CpaC
MRNTSVRTGATARAAVRLRMAMMTIVLAAMSGAGSLAAQTVLSQPQQTITLPRGTSSLLVVPQGITRVAIGDPNIADFPDPVSNTELIINGIQVGTTSLFIWDNAGNVTLYSIEVIPDITALRRQIELLFPDVPVSLTASGEAVVVSGTIPDAQTSQRILEILRSSGAQVIDNLVAPSAQQILLHVRFAEVNRSALKRFGADIFVNNPQDLGNAVDEPSLFQIETLSQGLVRLFLLGENGASLETVINTLKSDGSFRSLAEPNLVTMEHTEATFLAGGEFPFPILQGNQGGGTTIAWKEFGVRLNFTPSVTSTGKIRLNVTPEVSSLDFANGLTISGFQIPSILTRRTESQVELAPGQHLAIAGLLDNTMSEDVTKIPLLGDIPILGAFFQSREARNNQTELLVVVTPHIVEPVDAAPALPTGEPVNWDIPDWFKEMMIRKDLGVRILPGGGGGN